MTFTYRYRKQIILGVVIFILISIIIFLSYNYLTKNEDDKELVVEDKLIKKDKVEIEEVKVDIKGEINSPGIYTVKENSRVIDVIMKAGGLTENANTSVINLSKKVIDEMVIIIYSNLEIQNFIETKEMEKYLQNKCIQADENSLKNDACIEEDNSNSNTNTNTNSLKVNINTASKEELMKLTGIGEAKAKDIISYREKNGPFNSIDDLKKVSGIGDSTLESIRNDITV